MPNVVCPSCKTTLSVTDAMLGGEVQCGQCQTVFRTATGDTKTGGRRDSRDSRDERDEEEVERPKRTRSRRDEDEEDERPARRRRPRRYEEDEDEEERPRRRTRSRRYEDDYDDDDDYDRPRRGAGTGMAVTSMILGIIAVSSEVPAMMLTASGSLFCCGLGAVFTWPAHIVGVALGITGLVLGVPAMKKKEGKGMAVTGVATSIAALALSLISIILIAAGYAAWQRAVNNFPIAPPPPPPVFRGGR